MKQLNFDLVEQSEHLELIIQSQDDPVSKITLNFYKLTPI